MPDREALGRLVREVWVAWAQEQRDPKPSWLAPWDELAERDREVDRRIGEALAAAGAETAHDYLRAAVDELGIQRRRYEQLLGAIWLYIPWHYVTKQLTTEQKELFADAVDAHSARLNAGGPEIGLHPVERWWRDA